MASVKNQTVSSLPSLPGFDLETALRRSEGDWVWLRKRVLDFAETNREANGELRSQLEEAEWSQALERLRLLRATSGKLGAFALAETAAALEQALADVASNGTKSLPISLLDEFALCIGQLAEAECVLKAMDTDLTELEAELAPHPPRGADLADIESCLHTIQHCLDRDLSRVEGEIDVLLAHCRGSDMEELAVHLQNEFNTFNLAEISHSINQYFVSAR